MGGGGAQFKTFKMQWATHTFLEMFKKRETSQKANFERWCMDSKPFQNYHWESGESDIYMYMADEKNTENVSPVIESHTFSVVRLYFRARIELLMG